MAVLSGLLPVFLILALGVAARQWGLVGEASAAGLNRLVANLALPALLVLKIGTSRLDTSFSAPLVGGTVLVTVVVALVGLAIARLWGLPGKQRGVLAQAGMRGNLAYVAFPVVLATLGEAALSQAAVTAAVLIPVMNLLAVGVLEMNRTDRAVPIKRLLVRVMANPLVVGAFVGLLLAAARWQPWRWLHATLGILADFALPGALLALGAQLRLRQWRSVWRPTAAAGLLKLVALPAAGWWMLNALGVGGSGFSVGILLLAAPTAVASYPVAAELGGDTDLAGSCVVTSTMGAFVAYVGWALLLRG